MNSETISYQGGLVCQALMTFHGRARKLILDDLFELEREQLKAIFDSTPGSYLLEKMGATIPEKKFIEHIKKLPIDEIAFGKSGSRELDLTVYLVLTKHCLVKQFSTKNVKSPLFD